MENARWTSNAIIMIVKYLPATTHRPSRLKARVYPAKVTETMDFDHTLSARNNAVRVAAKLAKKLGYNTVGMLASVGEVSDSEYAVAFVDKS